MVFGLFPMPSSNWPKKAKLKKFCGWGVGGGGPNLTVAFADQVTTEPENSLQSSSRRQLGP